MSCNSAIYAINGLSTAVTANQIIPLTSLIRKFGNALSLSNYGVRIASSGYYEVNANVTIAPTASGAITIALNKNGVQIPGATATINTENAALSTSVAINAIVRQTCCAEAGTITITTSAAGTVSNAAMTVEKL